MKPLRPIPPGLARPQQSGWRRIVGAKAFRAGHAAEWSAAAWLIIKGYRILAFRLRTPGAEIDILAQKGGVLAVVEVKRRATAAAGETALSPDQRERLRLAGARLLRQRPGLRGLRLRLDTVTLASGKFPRHRRDL